MRPGGTACPGRPLERKAWLAAVRLRCGTETIPEVTVPDSPGGLPVPGRCGVRVLRSGRGRPGHTSDAISMGPPGPPALPWPGRPRRPWVTGRNDTPPGPRVAAWRVGAERIKASLEHRRGPCGCRVALPSPERSWRVAGGGAGECQSAGPGHRHVRDHGRDRRQHVRRCHPGSQGRPGDHCPFAAHRARGLAIVTATGPDSAMGRVAGYAAVRLDRILFRRSRGGTATPARGPESPGAR